VVVQGEDGLVVDLCAARHRLPGASTCCVADPLIAGTFLIEEDTPALLEAIADAWTWAARRQEPGCLVIWWLGVRGNSRRQLRIGGPSLGLAAAVAFAALLEPDRISPEPRVAYTGRVRPDGTVDTVGHLELKAELASRLGIHALIGPPGMGAFDSNLQVRAVSSADEALRATLRIAHQRKLRRRTRLAIGLSLVVALTVTAASVFLKQQIRVQHLRMVSIEQALAAQVQGSLSRNQDELAALVARQAYNFAQGSREQTAPNVDQALRDALGVSNFSSVLQDPGTLRSVAFSPKSRTLASWGGDQTVRLWDLEHPEKPPTVLRHSGPVSSVTFSADGKNLASGSSDATVRLWDLEHPEKPPTVLRHSGPVSSVTFSADGKNLASWAAVRPWGGVQMVQLWDLGHPGASPTEFAGPWPFVISIAFSPDGKTLAAGSIDNTVRLWDLGHPEVPPSVLQVSDTKLLQGSTFVRAVAFSPDSKTLASGSDDHTVRLWDLGHPGAPPTALRGHSDSVHSVAFSPDGRTLASRSDDATIRLWDLGPPAASPSVLQGALAYVRSVAFSPDSKTLASGSDDATIRLWDLGHPGTPPTALSDESALQSLGNPFPPAVRSVAFSPDGKTLTSYSDDDTVRLWDLRHPRASPTRESCSRD
jgi:WD40 repeat protein